MGGYLLGALLGAHVMTAAGKRIHLRDLFDFIRRDFHITVFILLHCFLWWLLLLFFPRD